MNPDEPTPMELDLSARSIHEAPSEAEVTEEAAAAFPYPPPFPPPEPTTPDAYQPSFAHCVLEFPKREVFPAIALLGKIYIAWDTNTMYRWNGRTYVELSSGGGGSVDQVQADWSETNSASKAYIKNKPTIPTVPTRLSAFINDAGYITGIAWNEITNKPGFAQVAFTGSYMDLTNRPQIPTVPTRVSAFSNDAGYLTKVSWDVVTGKPTFSTVATSGNYDDLANKPSIPTVPTNVSAFTNDVGYLTTVAWADVTDKPTFATVATSGSYNDLTDKPEIPAIPENLSAFTNDAGFITGVSWDEVMNKPDFTTVATTGDYNDLVNKPQIPAAQVNADWNASSGVSQILNKPFIPSVAADVGAVSRTGDMGLTGHFRTTGSIAALLDITVGDSQDSSDYVIITPEGIISTQDADVVIPGGKQALDPTNTLPVLATMNQIPKVPVKAVKRNGTALVPDAQGAVDVEVPTVPNLPLSVAQGGTGAITAASARENLGAMAATATGADIIAGGDGPGQTMSIAANLGDLWRVKAEIDSPTFIGTPVAPTAQAGEDSDLIATTAFVQMAIARKHDTISDLVATSAGAAAIAKVKDGTSTLDETRQVLAALLTALGL